jgi:hypothetical protein
MECCCPVVAAHESSHDLHWLALGPSFQGRGGECDVRFEADCGLKSDIARLPIWAKSRRSRQIAELVYCGAIMESHAGRDGCEAIEFAEATYLVASIS